MRTSISFRCVFCIPPLALHEALEEGASVLRRLRSDRWGLNCKAPVRNSVIVIHESLFCFIHHDIGY